MTGKLDAVAAELGRVTPLAASLADEALTGNLAAAESKLARLRGTLSSDPLSLWQGGPHPAAGTVDTSGADRLRDRVAAAVTRVDELVRLRDDARQRIADVTTAAAAARAAYEDAAAAWQRAAAKIAAEALPAQPPSPAGLAARLAGLDTLLAGGRWTRLASELDEIERELAAATADFRDTERAVVAILSQRDELRGLLGAYQAKAARLGAAEDPGLTERYDRAHGLLWTAPCDLAGCRGRGGRLPAGRPGARRIAAMTTATARCAQPGCDGTIQDGYCDTCGLAAPAASSGPSGSASSGPSGSASSGPSGSASSGPSGSAASGSSGSGGTRSRARGRGSSRSARGRLGAGLVDIPPVPYRDPASAVLTDPQVPEAKRYCSNCDQPVGRSRDGHPGLPEGFCRNCGTRFSFSPKLEPGDWSPASTRYSAASPTAGSAGSTSPGTATSATGGWC